MEELLRQIVDQLDVCLMGCSSEECRLLLLDFRLELCYEINRRIDACEEEAYKCRMSRDTFCRKG